MSNIAFWRQMFKHERFCAYWMWRIVNLCFLYPITMHNKKALKPLHKIYILGFCFLLGCIFMQLKFIKPSFCVWKANGGLAKEERQIASIFFSLFFPPFQLDQQSCTPSGSIQFLIFHMCIVRLHIICTNSHSKSSNINFS